MGIAMSVVDNNLLQQIADTIQDHHALLRRLSILTSTLDDGEEIPGKCGNCDKPTNELPCPHCTKVS